MSHHPTSNTKSTYRYWLLIQSYKIKTGAFFDWQLLCGLNLVIKQTLLMNQDENSRFFDKKNIQLIIAHSGGKVLKSTYIAY